MNIVYVCLPGPGIHFDIVLSGTVGLCAAFVIAAGLFNASRQPLSTTRRQVKLSSIACILGAVVIVTSPEECEIGFRKDYADKT